MFEVLDPIDLYDRGLRDLSSLRGAERLVFILQDFDYLMEMEGWDHFFIYEAHFSYYSEMKGWLDIIDDKASLAVLKAYEDHLKEHGDPLSSNDIQAFLNTQADAYFQNCPDWREQYCALRGDRWAKTIAYLQSKGQTLRGQN